MEALQAPELFQTLLSRQAGQEDCYTAHKNAMQQKRPPEPSSHIYMFVAILIASPDLDLKVVTPIGPGLFKTIVIQFYCPSSLNDWI